MDYSIRSADADRDARAIARVHSETWRDTYRNLLPARYLAGLRVPALTTYWHRRIASPAVGGTDGRRNIWVAEQDGEVAGFAVIGPCLDEESLIGFAGEVSMLYVLPAHTGRGLGRAMLEQALEELADREHYWCIVWVLEGNRGARDFYEHMGLRLDGARRFDRFRGEDVPVLRYAIALNPAMDFDALTRGARRSHV